MEMSVREARAGFATALDAAARGERVTITRNGKAIAELGPPAEQPKGGFDWDKLEALRREMGFDKYDGPPLDEEWRKAFDDPEWMRELFGPDYFDDEPAPR